MKLLKELIDNKHNGNHSRFSRDSGLNASCAQVKRWVNYGCYYHKGVILRPLTDPGDISSPA